MEKLLFTSESVTEGHPDKVCDAISDAILDALMAQDPMSRVACETATCTGFVLVTGEITTNAYVDIAKIVRDTVKEIGYNKSEYGFDGNTCAVLTAIDEQSSDIAMGVDKALEAKENKMSDEEIEAIGAGDQGMMFGYATNETEEYMPYPISLAHKLALQLTKIRKDGTLKYLRPDGKTQVSVEYDENGKPKRLEAVVLSTQHDDDVTQEQIHADIRKHVFDVILPQELIDENTKFFINPTGRFVIGGPHGDAGLTGRKIIVDTYGGYARHGGGAFSGKDCTKVDRSGAYAARYVAKNLVAVNTIKKSGINPVVCINRFYTDTDAEVALLKKLCAERGVRCAESNHWRYGGEGAAELARVVVEACEDPVEVKFLYDLEMPLRQRVELIAKEVYGADGVDWAPLATEKAVRFENDPKYADYCTMMVKTHLSLSDDPTKKGVPTGWRLAVRDILEYGGAKFLCPMAGTISMMPGTAADPAYRRVDVDTETGKVSGLF